MSSRKFAFLIIALMLFGCGVETSQGAKRTLTGISRQQVLISAQHTLAQKGLDVEAINFDSGEVTSEWDARPRRQTQYKVTVTPSAQGGTAEIETLVVSVSANSREKMVGGWSEPAPAASNVCDDLLDDIVEMSIERFGEAGTEIAAPSSMPLCSSTADCPDGTHCGSGRCVSECAGDNVCESGKVCDPRGRCVVPEPEPCPEIQPPPPPPPEDDSKKEKKKKHEKEGEEVQQ